MDDSDTAAGLDLSRKLAGHSAFKENVEQLGRIVLWASLNPAVPAAPAGSGKQASATTWITKDKTFVSQVLAPAFLAQNGSVCAVYVKSARLVELYEVNTTATGGSLRHMAQVSAPSKPAWDAQMLVRYLSCNGFHLVWQRSSQAA